MQLKSEGKYSLPKTFVFQIVVDTEIILGV